MVDILLEHDLTTRVPHTRWHGMATSSTSDTGTSEVSEMELETSGSAYIVSADTGDDTEAGFSVVSLLSVLCQPTPLQLVHKRKIQQHPVLPAGTKCCKGSTVNDRQAN